MKHETMTSLVTIAALGLVCATAHAQAPTSQEPVKVVPSSQPPPTPEADLSHINGVPIKVGDHNQYYYSSRRTNLSINPVGLVFGLYSASVSYAISRRVAIRGDVSLYSPPDGNESGYEIGVGFPIYFKKMYSGFFVEPGAIVRSMDDGYDESQDTETGPQLLVGWHWTWDSGLSLAMALGAGRDISTKDDYDYDSSIFTNGYFRVGYAF